MLQYINLKTVGQYNSESSWKICDRVVENNFINNFISRFEHSAFSRFHTSTNVNDNQSLDSICPFPFKNIYKHAQAHTSEKKICYSLKKSTVIVLLTLGKEAALGNSTLSEECNVNYREYFLEIYINIYIKQEKINRKAQLCQEPLYI